MISRIRAKSKSYRVQLLRLDALPNLQAALAHFKRQHLSTFGGDELAKRGTGIRFKQHDETSAAACSADLCRPRALLHAQGHQRLDERRGDAGDVGLAQ